MAEQRKDYYAILGVPKTATQEEIRTRYYDLTKKYHPDTQDPATKKIAEEDMSKFTEAYKVLSDPAQRAEYDKGGSSSRAVAKTVVGGIAAVRNAIIGPTASAYVHNAEKTIPWDIEKLGKDASGLAERINKVVQPNFGPKPQEPKKELKPRQVKKENEPLSILKKRYANGEITKEKYLEMKKDLES